MGLGNLGSNIYVNGVIVGVAEVMGNLTALFLIKNTKRKKLILTCILISSLCGLLHLFIGTDITCPNSETNCPKSNIITAFAMIVKYSVTIGYTVIFVYSTELLPTKIKATGLGICTFIGRAGSMIAPIITEYSKSFGIHQMVVFGIIGLISSLSFLKLKETKQYWFINYIYKKYTTNSKSTQVKN